MHQARYYVAEPKGIHCRLCPHLCRVEEGDAGFCGVRFAEKGKMYTANYGLVAASYWDPVEKKPLYHFYPGHEIFSIGTYGCNLYCSFCQNWNLARRKPPGGEQRVKPEKILSILERRNSAGKALGVAYTYNEPLVWFEYVYDTARLLREHGYSNILVTNGYVNPEPLHELLPLVDAMNIDLKAFTNRFYRKMCRGTLRPVLETIETACRQTHVEITCLVIPGLNDDPVEHEKLARYLASLSPDLPLHYSRYFPQYKLDRPPTGPAVLQELKAVAEKHLRYVYLGNVDLPGAADSQCPYCGNILVIRSGYRVNPCGLEGACCRACGRPVAFISRRVR